MTTTTVPAKATTTPRKMLSRAELARLRADPARSAKRLAGDPELFGLLLRQAEHALDCAAVLDELAHFPAVPYGEGAALVARITEACNELWNRYHYDAAR